MPEVYRLCCSSARPRDRSRRVGVGGRNRWPRSFDLVGIAASGEFDVVEGPLRRFGGDGTSLYVRDPDGLVVELRFYG